MSTLRRQRLRMSLPAFKRFDRHDHGTRSCYVHHGCRCDECRDAEADYNRSRNRDRRLSAIQRED